MANWPLVRRGDRGENVRTVQYLLRHHGRGVNVDGAFGPQTEDGVRSFQGERGLSVDGIVGPQTWAALIVQLARGSRGEAVRAVQSQLRFRGCDLAVDGDFGPATDEQVRRFQRNNGLGQDGIVGPQTWSALVSRGPLLAEGPDDAARHLYNAWVDNDRESALQAANHETVDALFATGIHPSPDSFQFTGCESHAGNYSCFFYQEGDGMNMRVEGGQAIGFQVTAFDFVAD